MPIYDSDGTTKREIGRVYDRDGTTVREIGRVYDSDGTTKREIWTAEEWLYNNGVMGYGFTGLTGSGSSITYNSNNIAINVSGSAKHEGSSVRPDGYKVTDRIITSTTSFSVKGYTKLTIVHGKVSRNSWPYQFGSIRFGISESSKNEGAAMSGSLNADTPAGTVEIDISKLTNSTGLYKIYITAYLGDAYTKTPNVYTSISSIKLS